jgi:hypothetical protein
MMATAMKKTTLLCTLLLAACAPKPATKTAAPPAAASPASALPAVSSDAPALPPNHPPVGSGGGAAPMDAMHGGALTKPAGEPISGTVLETLDSGGFTYVRFSTAKGERWAAIGQVALPRGATITIAPTMVGDRFVSQPLKRTFDNLIFGALTDVSSSDKPATAATRPSLPAVLKVAKAEGEHAHSITEIRAGSAIGDGQPVVVRGTVTKVMSGIMDRNWIHLRDGSGKDDEIVVTSQDAPSVGSIVTATGTLHRNRDFGSGYSYAVLIEEAKIH